MNTNAAVELTAEDCAIHKVQESFGKDFSHDQGTFSTLGVQCSIPSVERWLVHVEEEDVRCMKSNRCCFWCIFIAN